MQIRFSITLLALLCAIISEAQPKINSPLSRYGIGDDFSNRSHHLSMMGGLFGGFADEELLNLRNPASLGYLRATAFEVGVSAGKSNLEFGQESDDYNQGNLEHLSLAFPMRNSISEVLERQNTDYSWCMGIDLRSRTRVGYGVEVTDSTGELGEIIRTYEGSGGTYELGWVNAVRYKNLSVGADIGVLFGSIATDRSVLFVDEIDNLRNYFEDDISINGFRYRLGAQYRMLLNKAEESDARKRYLTLGLYGNSQLGFNTTSDRLYHGFRPFSGIRDTLVNENEIKGDGTMPGLFGFGVVYEPDLRWQLGINIELSDWGKFESEDFESEGFGNGYKIGAGFGFTPDRNAYGRYFKRVAYKLGAQYGKDGRAFNGQDVEILQINGGMSMPFYFLRQISHVHLGLEYKRTSADLITENYYGVTLSATFNDNSWFLKRKFN